MNELVYLDNAATTYPKPRNVAAVLPYSLYNYGNPGRSSHSLSQSSAKLIYSCREIICSLFNYQFPENVVFTYNTTYALNMAINGLCPKEGNIIISNMEHNSVLRPVNALCQKSAGSLRYSVFDCLGSEEEILSSFASTVTPDTSLAVISGCSNVTGKLLPTEKIGEICRAKGIKLILDMAQNAGIAPIDLSRQYFSAACFAGHKSLYGIMGSGFCIFAQNENPDSFIYGGNGTHSLSREQNGLLPERLESGTVGVPSIAALREGIKHVIITGTDSILGSVTNLSTFLTDNLENMKNITVIGKCDKKVGTVLFNVTELDSERVSSLLSEKGICTRGGFHCSGLCHTSLGTVESGGGVRASFSHFNSKEDVTRLTDALWEIVKGL